MALGYLPALFGGPDRLPIGLQKWRALGNWMPSTHRRKAVVGFVFWSAFTQFVPIVALLAFMDGAYRSSAILGVAGARNRSRRSLDWIPALPGACQIGAAEGRSN